MSKSEKSNLNNEAEKKFFGKSIPRRAQALNFHRFNEAEKKILRKATPQVTARFSSGSFNEAEKKILRKGAERAGGYGERRRAFNEAEKKILRKEYDPLLRHTF